MIGKVGAGAVSVRPSLTTKESARETHKSMPSRIGAGRAAEGERDWKDGTERNCSVSRTMNIFTDAWAFLIMREAFFGVRNFEGFRNALGITKATLAARLKLLSEQGIFKQVQTGASSRLEYRLTRKGYDLYPSCMALKEFGDRWLVSGEVPPLVLIHEECGRECRPIVACSCCREPLRSVEVTFRDGPGAGREPLRVGRTTRRASDSSRFLKGRPSSVSRTLQIIGDKWTFMVMREAFFGSRRYDQFQSRLNIASNVLTDRLEHLVGWGVFRQRLYQNNPPRQEYVLTAMGHDLYGPCVAMLAWGDKWLSDGKPPLILTHKTCGQDFRPVVLCDQCLEPIEAGKMQYVLNYDPDEFGAAIRKVRLVDAVAPVDDDEPVSS